ncbi:MAG TPA: hypothetical protein VLX92_14185 [Kofleriaceae bacterium]|nr:hypothetical protein [Kofleriaceae bacterium]
MNRDLTPKDGARLLLELVRDAGASASYRAAIYTPDATFEGEATLGDDGAVELAIAGAPDELGEAMRMQARLVARAASKLRDDGLAPWPSRVLRWRGPGRGG